MTLVIRGLGYYRNGKVVTSRDDLLSSPHLTAGLDEQLHDLLHCATSRRPVMLKLARLRCFSDTTLW